MVITTAQYWNLLVVNSCKAYFLNGRVWAQFNLTCFVVQIYRLSLHGSIAVDYCDVGCAIIVMYCSWWSYIFKFGICSKNNAKFKTTGDYWTFPDVGAMLKAEFLGVLFLKVSKYICSMSWENCLDETGDSLLCNRSSLWVAPWEKMVSFGWWYQA